MSDFGARAAKDFHSEAPPETVSPASERYGAVIPSEAFRWDHNSVTLPRGIWLQPGWVLGRILEASADTTLTYDDGYSQVFVTTGAANKTITLPAAASCKGQVREFWKVDTGAGKLIIDGNADELVNGFATMEFWYKGHGVVLYCDGTGWLRIGGTVGGWLPDRVEVTGTWTTAGALTVTLAGYVPVGTKTARLYDTATDATVDTRSYSRPYGVGSNYRALYVKVANVTEVQGIEMPLDASYRYGIFNTATFDARSIYVVGFLYE